MQFILDFFEVIRQLGASVMMPIIIMIMGLVLRAGVGKSIRAGLTVGVGFIGLNLVIGALGSNLVPAITAIVSNYGLKLSTIDVGVAFSGCDRVCFPPSVWSSFRLAWSSTSLCY